MSDTELMHEARKAEARDFHKRNEKNKAKPEIKEEFYELRNNKVVKITRMKNGNAYTTFIGSAKNCADLIAKHKLDGRRK
jgi:hypothetical protein